jgi:hypothetical protein
LAQLGGNGDIRTRCLRKLSDYSAGPGIAERKSSIVLKNSFAQPVAAIFESRSLKRQSFIALLSSNMN